MSPKLSGQQVIQAVIRQYYDLGEVALPRPVPAAHQRRHRKLIVDTAKGRFLVKTYPCDPVVLDALRFQHRLSEHLAQHNLPVARIVPAKSGKRIVEVSPWAIELQQFIEGHSMQVTRKTLMIAAEALGKFHDVCRDVPRPPREARMWRFSEVPRDHFMRFFERAKQEGDEAVLTAHCNAIALFLQDAGKALDWDARGEFETGLIHGDWHSGNLMFRGEELVAILDFEFAGEGCFLEDLSYAVSNLCVRTTPDPKQLTARTNRLLDYYQLHRRMSFAEEVALYFAVGVKHVTSVCCQIEQLGKVAGYNAAQWMQILGAQCDWLRERADKARWLK